MIARSGSGWQTLLADLSIILFIVTAGALSQAQDAGPPRADVPLPPPQLSARGEPLAIYRVGPGAPSLGAWLKAQSVDPRQQLTILAPYRPGGEVAALAEATHLLGEATVAGVRSRVVVEPGSDSTTAVLAFDLSDPSLARELLRPEATPAVPETR